MKTRLRGYYFWHKTMLPPSKLYRVVWLGRPVNLLLSQTILNLTEFIEKKAASMLPRYAFSFWLESMLFGFGFQIGAFWLITKATVSLTKQLPSQYHKIIYIYIIYICIYVIELKLLGLETRIIGLINLGGWSN